MRIISTGLAVKGLILLAAMPAAAGAQDMEGGEYDIRTAAPAEERLKRTARLREELREEGPRGPDRTLMLESMEVADNAELGIGLFSIVGLSEKEQIRRRTAPSPEVRDRDRRIAAIGFSLRF